MLDNYMLHVTSVLNYVTCKRLCLHVDIEKLHANIFYFAYREQKYANSFL